MQDSDDGPHMPFGGPTNVSPIRADEYYSDALISEDDVRLLERIFDHYDEHTGMRLLMNGLYSLVSRDSPIPSNLIERLNSLSQKARDYQEKYGNSESQW